MKLALLAPLLAPLTAPALAGDFHLVDFTGGHGFPTVQAAIDAAQSGDTILVKPPPASGIVRTDGFTVDGKGLTIIGQPMSSSLPDVPIKRVQIRHVPAGESVILYDFDLDLDLTSSRNHVLLVENSAGAVRLESCAIKGQYSATVNSRPAVGLALALDVSLFRCEVDGKSVAGIETTQSRIALYDCEVRGGRGKYGASYTTAIGGDGKSGLELKNRSFAWVGRSTITGGVGGDAECIHNSNCVSLPGDGGSGAVVEGGSLCVELESTFVGGSPGTLWYTSGPGSSPGGHGAEISGPNIRVPGAHRRLKAPRTVVSGDTTDLELTGLPGEEVILFAGEIGGHRFLGPLFGALLVNGGYVMAPTVLGTVPASGVFEAKIMLPTVASQDATTIALQAMFRTSDTRYRLSPVRQVTVVGDGLPTLEPTERLYLDASAPDGGDGRSWATAANNLADMLTDTVVSEEFVTEVWVATGTYTAAPSGSPMSQLAARFEGNLRVLGGFQGNEASAELRDPAAFPVVFTGDLAGDDSAPGGSRAENSVSLLTLFPPDEGAVGASLISGITFEHVERGTALWTTGSLVLEDCRFIENRYLGNGFSPGVISYVDESESEYLSVRRCHFYRNQGFAGGALTVFMQGIPGDAQPDGVPDVDIAGCSFVENSAPYVTDISWAGDASYGAAINVMGAHARVQVTNCTLINNEHALMPSGNNLLPIGGVSISHALEETFVNNVGWSDQMNAGLFTPYSLNDPNYNDAATHNRLGWIPPTWDQGLNWTADPIFRDPMGPDGQPGTGDEDYRLGLGSPLIDAGNSWAVPTDLILDLAGLPRFVDDPMAPDVGLGGTRIVDIGAYERQ